MESIVFEVDDAVAKAWKNSSPELRAAYGDKINAVLNELKETEDADEIGLTKAQQDFLDAEAAKNTERYEWWNDEDFVAELEQRAEDMKSGKVKGIPWEDVKFELLNRAKGNDK